MLAGLFWGCGNYWTCCPPHPAAAAHSPPTINPPHPAACCSYVTTADNNKGNCFSTKYCNQSSSWSNYSASGTEKPPLHHRKSLLPNNMGATVSSSTSANNPNASSSSCSPTMHPSDHNHHHHHQHMHHQTTVMTASGGGSSTSLQQQPPPVMRERRKKTTGFATLRKKFIRRRRSSKSCDHSRVLRDFVSDWTPLELAALLDEFEGLSALKDLAVQAELARPPATTFKQDLSALYDSRHCTDCELVFRGTIFPVHRALLSARCTYFRDLLAGCPGYGARICLELRSSPIDVPMFSALLRYLYTGDLCPHDQSTIDLGILKRLGEDFGNPNPLENDLKYLLESGDYADAALIFTADGGDFQRPDSGSSEYGFRPKLELPCHKAILSARSPFFRNLIQRRSRSTTANVGGLPGGDVVGGAAGVGGGEGVAAASAVAADQQQQRALHVPTRIVLDETVIPKRYARVLLHAIYMDTVDLGLILRGNGCGTTAGSLGEVQALTQNGRARLTPLEEAMELYQIGRFLELDILAQGCEDLILEWLKLETLPTVLRWASQPHGSAWVYRQSCHFLREEFSAISASPVLHQLEKGQLITALQSNFLQASELEVLQSVLKWGEQELIRRMEDREPNLLSHTAHSVTRKGVKKRDLSDVELREILSELLPLVRMDHVLPPNSEVLTQAIRRGLVSTPPSHMIGDERENLRVNAWIRTQASNNGLFVRPRLFMPYFEEVKQLLEDHLATQQLDMLRMRMSRHMPDIPDTLYMVSRLGHGGAAVGTASGVGGAVPGGSGNLDVVAAALPAPDSATMQAMVKREIKLRQSPCCQRAMGLPLSSKHEINRQIRLRVVREFNFPDAVSDLLETASCYCVEDIRADVVCGGMPMDGIGSLSAPPSPAIPQQQPGMGMGMGGGSQSRMEENPFGNLTFGRHQQQQQQLHHHQQHLSTLLRQRASAELPLPSLVQDGELGAMCADNSSGSSGSIYGRLAHGVGGGAGGLSSRRISHDELEMAHSCPDGGMGHLSEIMPDVAMATASLGQLQLGGGGGGMDAPESLQLDLGDGSSHLGAIGLNVMHHNSMQHHHNLHAASSYHHYMRSSGGAGGPGHSLSPYALHRQSAAGSSGNIAGGSGSAGGPTAGGAGAAGPSGSSYHPGPPRFL